MTTTTNTTAPATPANAFGVAQQVVQDLELTAPWVQGVLPLIPSVGAQAALVFSVANSFEPAIVAALGDLAASNGGNWLQAMGDFISHITPGAPNAPALSPAPATPVAS